MGTRDPEATLNIVLIMRPLPPPEQSLITKGLAGLPRPYSLLRLLLDFLLQQLQLFKQGVPQTMGGQLRQRIHISTVLTQVVAARDNLIIMRYFL